MKSEIASGAIATFLLKAGGVLFGFLVNLAIARLLGAEGFGAYAFAFSVAGLLSVFATLGQKTRVMRDVARSRAGGDRGAIRGVCRRSSTIVLLASLFLALPLAGLLLALGKWEQGSLNQATIVGLCLVPLLASMHVVDGALRGLQRIVASQVPPELYQRLIMLTLVGLAYIGLIPGADAVVVIGFSAVALAICLAIVWGSLRRALPARGVPAAAPAESWRDSLRLGLPFLLIDGIHIVHGQTDRLMLGILADAEAVGLYHAAYRYAHLVLFASLAIGIPLAPAISRRHAAGDRAGVQRALTKAARLGFLAAVVPAAAFVGFGPTLLGLFGAAFVPAQAALAILAVGYAVRVALGHSAQLAMMIGHERLTAGVFGAAALLNAALNLAFIPVWGVSGAAAATAVSTVAIAIALAVLMIRRTGLDATLLGVFAAKSALQRA